MGERWPPVYDAEELQRVIREISSREGLAKHMYAPVTEASSFFQGDVVALDAELPLLDENAQPATDSHVAHWMVLGNSCDLARTLEEVPFTQLLPVRQLVSGATEQRLAALTGYRVSRQFYLPDWTDGEQLFYADYLSPVTITRQGLAAKAKLQARMSHIGWMLLHACTVRFLCRDDCCRARWMREKWAWVSAQNDGEAHGRGQDSISKPGEEGRRGRVLRGGPPPRVRVRPRQHA